MQEQDKFFAFDFENEKQPERVAIPEDLGSTNKAVSTNTHQGHLQYDAGGKNVEQKANNEFDIVMSNAKAVDVRLAELLAQNQGTVRTFFPSKMQRLINEKERLMVGTAMDFRINLLKLGNQFRLEAMRDRYDVYLKCYKGQNRLELTQFMMKKITELHRTVKVEEMAGFRELEEMYDIAATLRISSMRENQVKRIQAREHKFMDSIEKLITHYQNIIDENLTF